MKQLSIDEAYKTSVAASLPPTSTLTSALAVGLSNTSYRVHARAQIALELSEGNQLVVNVVWKSVAIKLRKGGRNKESEQDFLKSLSIDGWLERASQQAAPACASALDPAPASGAGLKRLREEKPELRSKPEREDCSEDASSKLEGNNHGGKRAGAGRQAGSVGKTEFDKLVKDYRRQFESSQIVCASLTLVQLRQCIKYFDDVQEKLLLDEKRKISKKYKGSRAVGKLNEFRAKKEREARADEDKKLAEAEFENWCDYSVTYLKAVLHELFHVTAERLLVKDLQEMAGDADEQLSAAQECSLLAHAQGLLLYYQLMQQGCEPKAAHKTCAEFLSVSPDTLRKRESEFRSTGKLPISMQGRSTKFWLLSEEDFKNRCIEFVRSHSCVNGVANMTTMDFHTFINTEIMPELSQKCTATYNAFKGLRVNKLLDPETGAVVRHEISHRTACYWLHKLGFGWDEIKGGVYYDGHDRADVIEYRREVYLVKYFYFRDYAEVWYKVNIDEARALKFDEDWLQRKLLECAGDSSLGDSQLWLSVDDFDEPLVYQQVPSNWKLESKKTLPDGRKVLFVYQDECIYRCEY